MISITCTQCRTTLTIDEAFAGGVCRCQHCGTIQTVPAQLKPSASPYGPSATTSKSLYQNQSAPRTTTGNTSSTGAASPSGLDDLAQAVVSSGLAGSGLRSSRLTSGTTPSSAPMPVTPQAKLVTPVEYTDRKPVKKFPMVPLAIGGVIVLAAIGVTLFFVLGSGSKPGLVAAAPSTRGTFCGVTLAGPNVIFVIDRANSMKDRLDDVKDATYQSIQTLGADGKFAVILWHTGPNDVAYPGKGLVNATSDQLTELKKKIQNENAGGASVLRGGLERAMAASNSISPTAANPTSIVIVTAKNKLDPDDEDAVGKAKADAGGKIKFYAFSINIDNSSLNLASGPDFQYKKITAKDFP